MAGAAGSAAATSGGNSKRVLGTLKFVAVAFFLVSGGPFGIEPAVVYAGPLPCFLAFLVFPLCWSLPQALVTAELSTLLPSNGGYILWVTTAFNDFAGWMIGVNGVVASVLDLSIYPILFAEYALFAILPDAPPPPAMSLAIRFGVIAAGVWVNIRGLSGVGSLSVVITAGIFMPFLVSLVFQAPAVVAGLPHAAAVAPTIEWSGFLATIMWSFTGWDALGSLAGEVKDPRRTYIAGTLLTLVVATASYALPLIVSITTHPDFENWRSGSFAAFTGDLSPWLATACTLASLMSQVAIFNAGLSTSARVVRASCVLQPVSGASPTAAVDSPPLPSLLAGVGTRWRRGRDRRRPAAGTRLATDCGGARQRRWVLAAVHDRRP